MKTAVSRRRALQLAMAPAVLAGAQVDDLAPTVSRVYPGPDGKLFYVPDEQGNTILDSSYAGYGGGGVPIPVMCGAPLDQQASLKGGPYSQGVYKVNFQKGEGAFGWVTIVDRRDEIELRYSGRNLRNEEKISLRFTVPARGISP